MPETTEQLVDLEARNSRLREELERARAENARLRHENHELRSALDAHVARARSTATFGPIEMTAGTCVGPRRSGERGS